MEKEISGYVRCVYCDHREDPIFLDDPLYFECPIHDKVKFTYICKKCKNRNTSYLFDYGGSNGL